MSNEELLVAIKGVVEVTLETKLEEKLEPIHKEIGEMKTEIAGIKTEIGEMQTEISGMKNEIKKLSLDNENVIKPQLRLLAENYVPAAKKYEKSVDEMEQVKFDVDILKNVVAKHSEALQKIS